MAAGTTPQQKHVLHHLVKKVLVHDRRTVEVWYGLPNPPSVSRPGKLAPQMSRSTNRRPSLTEPEIWFRIVHITPEIKDLRQEATDRAQTVEIALGPKGTFENGNIGTLTRRVPGCPPTGWSAPSRPGAASRSGRRNPGHPGWLSYCARPSSGGRCSRPVRCPIRRPSPAARASPGPG